MIYPNGTVELNKLRKMIESPMYNVYVEDLKDRPEDWDFLKKGMWRGPRTLITDTKEVIKYLFEDRYTICYDLTDKYYEKHPYNGESKGWVKPRFCWQYAGKKGNFEIRYTEGVNRKRKTFENLEVIKHDGDFESTCFVIAYWDLKESGYEFHSCMNRLFECVDMGDFDTVWAAIVEANKYLDNLWENRPRGDEE